MQRWVVRYSPQLEEQFRKHHKKSVGGSWRMDETHIKIKRQWVYLYRAVDKEGNTVDFTLSEKRDKAGIDAINLQLALLFMFGGMFYQIDIRQIKYLNNIVEQDHRFIKKITKPMCGFKSFEFAKATIAGIELHHILRKSQHINAANTSIFEQFNKLAA